VPGTEIDPAAPRAWSNTSAVAVLVRSRSSKRRIVRALRAGTPALYAALMDPREDLPAVKAVGTPTPGADGVELRIDAPDLSEEEAGTLAAALARILDEAGVRDALITLPPDAPAEPAPAPAHFRAAAEARGGRLTRVAEDAAIRASCARARPNSRAP
jgi:hypothetical protein